LNHSKEIFCMVFVADNYSSEILKPGKKSLHFPSASIAPEPSSVLSFGLLSSTSVRGDHLNTALKKKLYIKAVTIICLITNETVRCMLDKTAVYRCLNQLYFVWRSACHVSGDRNTRSVCDCHDLGAFAALRLADSKTPFFAGAKLPSMNASRISISPRSYRSSASSWTMRWNTPWRTHFWNRRWHVWYGGYRWGRSFQGAPVRNTHKIPFNTSRGSRAGRPLGSLGGVNDLIIGSIRFHCSFVMSILIILHNQVLMSSFF